MTGLWFAMWLRTVDCNHRTVIISRRYMWWIFEGCVPFRCAAKWGERSASSRNMTGLWLAMNSWLQPPDCHHIKEVRVMNFRGLRAFSLCCQVRWKWHMVLICTSSSVIVSWVEFISFLTCVCRVICLVTLYGHG